MLGDVTVPDVTSYARLRKAVAELECLSWCPPVRQGGMVLDVPLDFEFLVDSPDQDETVTASGDPVRTPLSVNDEVRSTVVPDALGRVYIRLHDVIFGLDSSSRRTHTPSPLGPVGTMKAANSRDLLAAAERTRAEHGRRSGGEIGLHDQLCLTIADDDAMPLPHLSVSPGSRNISPIAAISSLSPSGCCPTCCYSRYRRWWLYKDPRKKRRVWIVLAALLFALVVYSVTPSNRVVIPFFGSTNEGGSLRFDGMGSVLMDPNVLSHTRTVELRFALGRSEVVRSQGLVGYAAPTLNGPAFGMFIQGKDQPTVGEVPVTALTSSLVYYRVEEGITNICVSADVVHWRQEKWHHVAVAFSDRAGTLFIDDVPVNTTCSLASSGVEITRPLTLPVGNVAFVGSVGFTNDTLVLPLSGWVSHVRTWSVALTPSDITAVSTALSLTDIPRHLSSRLQSWFPCSSDLTDIKHGVVHSMGARASMSTYGDVKFDKDM